ncbi:MAG: NDP-sugar synthase [Deltaproteobacteria bacterium]|nr:NDP-sugar synthase [Deltaproteobacteria bacterium]
MRDNVRGFVLAAGLGTRLRPLTDELPKPAWPLFDVPLAAHVLRTLAGARVREVVVNLHHLPDRLRAALTPWIPGGVTVHWSPEDPILGTGGALTPWRNHLARGPFFLCNADTYQEIDLGEMAAFHQQRHATATLAVRPLPPGQRGPIEIDGDGRIVRFLGSGVPGTAAGTPCEFTGIHLLEPGVLADLPDRPCCINADVHAPRAARGERLFGYVPPADSFWSDLGTPHRYLAAHHAFLSRGRLPPGTPGHLVVEDGAAEGGGRVFAPSYLGPGARVAAGACAGPYAVLGSGVSLEGPTRVGESVVWAGAKVDGEEVRRAVVSPSGVRLSTPPSA